MSLRYHTLTVVESQHHIIDPTNPCGALDDGIEHRLHVRGRSADDPEYFRRCRLVFEGLTQFGVALLDFFKQADVLDGDDGLVGKGLEKSYLLFREWA